MTAITRRISEFAAGISFDKVPTEVIERTGMLLMDSVGIALRARHDAESTPGLVKAAMRLGLDGGPSCGMIFARPDVRQQLGVVDKPVEDPEVAAGRLRVADRELHEFLYSAVPAEQLVQSNVIARGWSAWTIAREKYDSPSTLYRFPNGEKLRGDQIRNWDQIPVGTRVEIGQPAPNAEFEGFVEVNQANRDARGIVGDVFAEVTTIYFLPNGLVRTGEDIEADAESRAVLENLPPGTRILVGYIYGGHITRGRFPRQIAGVKWNYPSTFYRLPDGRILSGDEIDQHRIPRNTLVFYQS